MTAARVGGPVWWKSQSRHPLQRGLLIAVVPAGESLARIVVRERGELGPGALGLSRDEALSDRYLVEMEGGRLCTPRAITVENSMRQWPEGGAAEERATACQGCANLESALDETRDLNERMAAEVQHLRSVLDAAPHGPLCLTHGNRYVCTDPDCGQSTGTYVDEDGCCTTCGADATPHVEPGPCGCWKSRALRGVDPLSPVGSGASKGGTDGK